MRDRIKQRKTHTLHTHTHLLAHTHTHTHTHTQAQASAHEQLRDDTEQTFITSSDHWLERTHKDIVSVD